MPLHLLGKKSWNVYNADNVARVRRDEAEARAREEAEEQRMQQVDAERRLAILRGEVPPPLEEPPAADSSDHGRRHRERNHLAGDRKRKRAGEDDTDFEMRLARECSMVGENAARELSGPVKRTFTTTASLVDRRGHITLFGEEMRLAERSEGVESEVAKKKQEEAEQHQVRFTSAAGRDAEGLLAKNAPWYATPDGDVAALVPSKNVFGKEDPGRKAREVEKLSASDPLAMMKRGAKMVRDLNKERERENEERERALKELRKEERRREKRRRSEHHREKRHDGASGDESDYGKRSRPERRERDRSRDRLRDKGRHSDRYHDCDRDHEQSRRHGERESKRDRERSSERERNRERRRDHSRDRPHRRSSRERNDGEHHKHGDRDGHDGKHDRHRHHRSERRDDGDKRRLERDGRA